MMKNLKLIVLLIAIVLSSCKSKNKIKNENLDETKMYGEAKKSFLEGRYSYAANMFEKIEENFPFTVEGNNSVIMSAYSYYKANKFDDSIRIVEYYKKINFDAKNIEYIHFLEIMNYLSKINKYKKDMKLQKKVLELISQMNYLFPNSKYITYINEKNKNIINMIIRSELSIVDFYLKNNNAIGALNHLKILESSFYYKDVFFAEINYRFFEVYKYLGHKKEFSKYYLLLEKYSKNTKWYQYANEKL